MRFGVADYGMNVWEGGAFDLEARLTGLKEIGYEGLERLEAATEADALQRAAVYHRMGMDFATVRGPSSAISMQWAAAFGKGYVWTDVQGRRFDVFCRQANIQAEACRRWGLQLGMHNHLGSPVESQEELVEFLARCPGCGLVLDTAHLAAAGGDPLEIVEKHGDRLIAIHLKDWLLTNPEIGLDQWAKRGRFCGLGAGNIGLDNAAVMRAVVTTGYDGWVFVEHDTHLQDPLKDLAISRQYLRDAGF